MTFKIIFGILFVCLLINTVLLYMTIDDLRNVYSLRSIKQNIKTKIYFIYQYMKKAFGLNGQMFVDEEKVYYKTLIESTNESHLFDINMSEQSLTCPAESNSSKGSFDGLFFENTSLMIECFMNEKTSFNRIGYTKDIIENPIPFIALLSSMVLHGHRDGNLSFSQLLERLCHRHISLTCGEASAFFREVLKKLGVKSRTVAFLTLDDWNTYDNGHTLLEVYVHSKDQWVLVDVDQKLVFKDFKNQNFLSSLEFAKLNIDDIKGVFLNNANIDDYRGDGKYQIMLDYLRHNRCSWYKRISQSVGILDDESNQYYFLDLNNYKQFNERIESYCSRYVVLNQQAFDEKFYL